MAMNVRLIFKNLLDDATGLTMTPTPEASLPVTNLQVSRRSRVVRTQDTSDHTITGNLDDLRVVSSIAMWRHNLSESAQWRVRFYEDANQSGTVVYDSGQIDVTAPKTYGDLTYGIDPYGATVFSTGQTARYAALFWTGVAARSFKINLYDSSNPDGYMEIDRLFIGAHFEPSVNISYGLEITYQDDSTQTRTEGNSVHVDSLEPYRTMSMALDWLSDSEKTKMLEFIRLAGLRSDVFVSVYPGSGGETERDHGFVGKLTQVPGLTHTFYNNHTASLVIEES